ncbi:MAG: hypothetical protein Q9212_003895 [Teloschistes hypoglaucus]
MERLSGLFIFSTRIIALHVNEIALIYSIIVPLKSVPGPVRFSNSVLIHYQVKSGGIIDF